MEGNVRNSLFDLEQYRTRLEGSLSTLRKQLQHWQTLEAEYEGLKEELESIANEPTNTELVAVGRNFGGTVMNENEIHDLLGTNRGLCRTRKQVIDVLSRRSEYVQRNVQTIQKQIEVVERKLSNVMVVSEPDSRNEEELPVAEIREELDENDQVIASSISHPQRAQATILDAFERAQQPDHGKTANRNETIQAYQTQKTEETLQTNSSSSRSTEVNLSRHRSVLERSPVPGAHDFTPVTKNRSKSGHSEYDVGSLSQVTPRAGVVRTINNTAATKVFKPSSHRGNRFIELNENDEEINSLPVIPVDESAEDAALRKEMLEYGLSEVNAVVAEINLDGEGESSGISDDESVDEDEDFDDEEDEHGRSIRSTLTERYREEMLELERKLKAGNSDGHAASDGARDHNASQDDRRVAAHKDGSVTDIVGEDVTSTKRKSVRFAKELSVSSPQRSEKPAIVRKNTNHAESELLLRPPLSSDVIERQKDSTKLIEDFSTVGIESGSPHQEARMEYHKMRNRLFQSQGGFMPSEEEREMGPLHEERNGILKKVSRFKAARLKGLHT